MGGKTPFYKETQAILYATFSTESPKAEGRITFVFCIRGLIIFRILFFFFLISAHLFEPYFINRIIFPWKKKNSQYWLLSSQGLCFVLFKLHCISIIFCHIIAKIRTEVCSNPHPRTCIYLLKQIQPMENCFWLGNGKLLY